MSLKASPAHVHRFAVLCVRRNISAFSWQGIPTHAEDTLGGNVRLETRCGQQSCDPYRSCICQT